MKTEAHQIINSAREYLAEYSEMTSEPDQLLIEFLAGQVAQLMDAVSYLEKRIECVRS